VPCTRSRFRRTAGPPYARHREPERSPTNVAHSFEKVMSPMNTKSTSLTLLLLALAACGQADPRANAQGASGGTGHRNRDRSRRGRPRSGGCRSARRRRARNGIRACGARARRRMLEPPASARRGHGAGRATSPARTLTANTLVIILSQSECAFGRTPADRAQWDEQSWSVMKKDADESATRIGRSAYFSGAITRCRSGHSV
jgi:hypothetical protein